MIHIIDRIGTKVFQRDGRRVSWTSSPLGGGNGLMNNVFDSVVRKYIGLYQTVADRHCDLMGDIQIFPGKLMADITEEEQVRTLNTEIQRELSRRLAAININID